jgi:small subunit ribosomal protein S6
MNIYENFLILNASLSDEEISTSISKIKDIIVNAGGEVLKADLWGRKKLAYEIKKQNKGYYVLLVYKAPSSTIKILESYYKVFDPVIKFMVIKLGPKQIKHFENTQLAAKAAAESAEGEQTKKEA